MNLKRHIAWRGLVRCRPMHDPHDGTSPPAAPLGFVRNHARDDSAITACSFCGKSRRQVSNLIAADLAAGAAVICNECIDVAVGILAEQPRKPPRVHRALPYPNHGYTKCYLRTSDSGASVHWPGSITCPECIRKEREP